MRNLDKRVSNTYYTSNSGTLGSYLSDISKYKILSPEELKKALFKAQKGDQESINKIVNCNQRFVFSLAKRFSNGNNTLLSDLINEANIGLITSIQRFDHNRNVTFLTYAVYWMQRQIFLYLTFTDPLIKVSNKSKTTKIPEIVNKFLMLNGRKPTTEEILAELQDTYGISILNESDIYQINSTSIDNPTITENYDDFSSFFAVGQGSENTSGVMSDNNYDSDVENEYSRVLISNSIGILSEKEKKVVELLYGIGNFREYEIQEVAEQMGMSNEGVRLINKRALEKLKEEISIKQISI